MPDWTGDGGADPEQLDELAQREAAGKWRQAVGAPDERATAWAEEVLDRVVADHVMRKPRPCVPDCGGYADYAAVPCPNPACDDRVQALWAQRHRISRVTSEQSMTVVLHPSQVPAFREWVASQHCRLAHLPDKLAAGLLGEPMWIVAPTAEAPELPE